MIYYWLARSRATPDSGEKAVASTDLEVPDIGDPTLEVEVVRDITLIKIVLVSGMTLFTVWIITMLLLP